MRLWVNDCSFTQHIFEYPLKWLQLCLVVTWLVPCETAATWVQVLCTPCNHAPIDSVTLFKAVYLPHAPLTEWPGSFMYYCGGTFTKIRVNIESWPRRRKFSHHSCWVLNKRSFDHKYVTLPLGHPHSPQCVCVCACVCVCVCDVFLWLGVKFTCNF